MQPTSNNQQPTTFKYFITSFKYFSKLFSTSAPGQETLLTLVLKNLYDWNISPVLCLFLFPLAVPSSNISCMDASCFHSHDYHQMPEIDDSPSLSTILTNTLSSKMVLIPIMVWYYLWLKLCMVHGINISPCTSNVGNCLFGKTKQNYTKSRIRPLSSNIPSGPCLPIWFQATAPVWTLNIEHEHSVRV